MRKSQRLKPPDDDLGIELIEMIQNAQPGLLMQFLGEMLITRDSLKISNQVVSGYRLTQRLAGGSVSVAQTGEQLLIRDLDVVRFPQRHSKCPRPANWRHRGNYSQPSILQRSTGANIADRRKSDKTLRLAEQLWHLLSGEYNTPGNL